MPSKFSYWPAKPVAGTIVVILSMNTFYRKENCIEKEKTNDMTFDLKIVDTALCLCITSNN